MIRILSVVAAALVALPAAAQQPPPPGEPPARLGVGAGLSTASATPSVRIPLIIPLRSRGGYVRLEPYASYLSTEQKSNPGGVATTIQTLTESTLEAGATLGFAGPVFPYAYGFGGVRAAAVRRSYARETATTTATTKVDDAGIGYLVAALVGGEVFIHPRLSVGVEGGFGYQSLPKLEGGNPTAVLRFESTSMFTTGEAVVRFWFK